MNAIKHLFFLSLLSVTLLQCSPKTEKTMAIEAPKEVQKSLVVYGSPQCPHCIDFVAKMDSVGLQYTFNDVDNSDALFQEMYDKVIAAGHTGNISFPVVVVDNNQLFVAPDIKLVVDAIK